MSKKAVSVSAEIVKMASSDPFGVLAKMIVDGIGVSLTVLSSYASNMISSKNDVAIAFCLAAGIQVQDNVTFLPLSAVKNFSDYEKLVIRGRSDIRHEYNFRACHVIGHILASLVKDALALSIIGKSGNCYLGGKFADSVAGNINKSIYEKWMDDDKKAAKEILDKISTPDLKYLEEVLKKVVMKAAEFEKTFQASKKPSSSASSSATSAPTVGSGSDVKKE